MSDVDGKEISIWKKPKQAVEEYGEEIEQIKICDSPCIIVEEDSSVWKIDPSLIPIAWKDLTTKQKVKRVLKYVSMVCGTFCMLYLFICSLDLLGSAFRLAGGKAAGSVFRANSIMSNPLAGLMIGVLVTVLVQSSSTSTSIIISMVGAEILTERAAVPIVMGANIGTSVTNTLVAMGQITNSRDFRRAFAGATVHDMFNWMTVLILLPLEILTGYLHYLSEYLVGTLHLEDTLKEQDLLKVITKPFTSRIIEVSSSGISKIATGDAEVQDTTLLKTCCDHVKPADCCSKAVKGLTFYRQPRNYTLSEQTSLCQTVQPCVTADVNPTACVRDPWKYVLKNITEKSVNTLNCTAVPGIAAQTECCMNSWRSQPAFANLTANASLTEQRLVCDDVSQACYGKSGSDVVTTCINSWTMGRVQEQYVHDFSCKAWTKLGSDCNDPCRYLFKGAHVSQGGPLSDEGLGALLLVISLVLLCFCLLTIVKLLNAMLKGPMAKVIHRFINADFPGRFRHLTGYVAILLGAMMTVLLQSSSIFTSALTPLVGIGVIDLERMYPLTLGSNIGTTFTGILAALAAPKETIPRSLQVAFCHLFFNVTGIVLFYPLPFTRLPIPAARFLGDVTARYRWFSIVYILFTFFLMPLLVFGLSLAGWDALAAVLIPVFTVALLVTVVSVLQRRCPERLPARLRTWKWLPLSLRSLEPYDRCMRATCFCRRFQDGRASLDLTSDDLFAKLGRVARRQSERRNTFGPVLDLSLNVSPACSVSNAKVGELSYEESSMVKL